MQTQKVKASLGKKNGKEQQNSLLFYLGGARNVSVKQLNTPMDLITLTRTGIPKRALTSLAKNTSLSLKELAQAIHLSERTLQRYSEDHILDKAATEKVIALAQLYHYGEEVFGSQEKFNGWMRHPSVYFGGKPPLTLLDTTTGLSLIQDELIRIEHGVFA